MLAKVKEFLGQHGLRKLQENSVVDGEATD